MNITVKNGKMSIEEQKAYVDYLQNKYQKKLESLVISIDGDYVDLDYKFQAIPFERIRRITGYLVGTLDKWNDGKRAEEADRVKHGTSDEMEQL